MNTNRVLSLMVLTAAATSALMISCKPPSEPVSETPSTERGEPVLMVGDPIFDESSQTFSLTLSTDSAADATVTYLLLDGDSLLMQGVDGHFTGIAPLEEGYNVQARVEWSDTAVVTPAIRVLGFIIPREPVEKLSLQELQRLINTRDNETMEKYLAQRVKLTILDSQMKPTLLHDVFLYLEHNVWESVSVSDVTYDDNNLITAIILKPIEHIEPITDDDDGGDYYDEY